jgi:hypothetical protein
MLFDDKTWFELKNRRLMLELIAILNKLSERFNDDKELQNVTKYIKDSDIIHLATVFLSPEGRQWISFTYRSLRDTQAEDQYLQHYSNWLGINRNDLLVYLKARLNLFVVSLITLSGKGPASAYDFTLPDSGFFPGIDLYWKDSPNKHVIIDNNSVLIIANESEYLNLDIHSQSTIRQLNLHEIPKSDIYPFGIDLYSEASRINFAGREHLSRVPSDDKSRISNQIKVIEVALGYIKKSNVSVFNYFCEERNYFVPLIGPDGALPSSSNSSVDTLIWYSTTSQPLLVAEMIMHENSHQRLFRLQDIDPLIDNVKHGSGWDLCEIYSPWRDDPRPVNGVLHGFIVFSEASKFWFDLIQSADLSKQDLDISKRRLAMLVLQLEFAEKSLSGCSFTEKGNMIFEYYSEFLNTTLLPFVYENSLGELTPFFMEHHDQIEITGTDIQTAVKKHKYRWEQTNGR